MKPCKHLDYTEGKYTDCELIDETKDPRLEGFSCPVRYWKRPEYMVDNGPGQKPNRQNVQFCGAGLGRINGIFACYNSGEMPCYATEEAPK